MSRNTRLRETEEYAFADNGEQRSRTNWDFAEPLTKGRICQGVVDDGGWISERRTRRRRCDEETMRGLQTRRVKAHHLLVLPAKSAAALSRAATAHKRVLFHTEMPARHSGGRINRAERARAAARAEHGTHTRWNNGPRSAIRFLIVPCTPRAIPSRFLGEAWPLPIKTDDCETRQPVTASRTDPAVDCFSTLERGKSFHVGD
ncbi:hypothetical protein K0M31_003403 [Melipona bicolor]|uniref:Uncharacterized protein n=1 Tax=Melipona bicolor TaxID=60889 RepID=A0AA40FYP1_9HYME|nr:hypothetical protein K0M31_003403 [Melipona bicolor]